MDASVRMTRKRSLSLSQSSEVSPAPDDTPPRDEKRMLTAAGPSNRPSSPVDTAGPAPVVANVSRNATSPSADAATDTNAETVTRPKRIRLLVSAVPPPAAAAAVSSPDTDLVRTATSVVVPVVDDDDAKVTCRQCRTEGVVKRFTRVSSLRKHEMRAHTAPAVSFRRATVPSLPPLEMIDTHGRVSTMPKVFPCLEPTCTRRFWHPCSRARHIKMVHAGGGAEKTTMTTPTSLTSNITPMSGLQTAATRQRVGREQDGSDGNRRRRHSRGKRDQKRRERESRRERYLREKEEKDRKKRPFVLDPTIPLPPPFRHKSDMNDCNNDVAEQEQEPQEPVVSSPQPPPNTVHDERWNALVWVARLERCLETHVVPFGTAAAAAAARPPASQALFPTNVAPAFPITYPVHAGQASPPVLSSRCWSMYPSHPPVHFVQVAQL